MAARHTSFNVSRMLLVVWIVVTLPVILPLTAFRVAAAIRRMSEVGRTSGREQT